MWLHSVAACTMAVCLIQSNLSATGAPPPWSPPRAPSPACVPPHHTYTFCNTSLRVAQRALALAQAMTVEELVSQMVSGSSPGLPPVQYTTECQHEGLD